MMTAPINYNLTNLTSVETILDIAKFSNEATNDAFWSMAMIAIFFILFLMMQRNGFLNGLMTSSFISLILSTLLVGAKLINFMFPLAFLILTGLTLLFSYTAKK